VLTKLARQQSGCSDRPAEPVNISETPSRVVY
jgi:hypothetical protein